MTEATSGLDAMAPKRRRMMDMILALGGLKEESAIPLSKVNEEIASLGSELEPLTDKILAFPDAYFEEFFEAAEKSNIVSQITDKSILREAIASLEKACSILDTSGVRGLLEQLESALHALEGAEDTGVAESAVDLGAILEPLPDLIVQIESVLEDYESKRQSEAEVALAELESLVKSISDVLPEIEKDVSAALETLQKLGTKTRYGPFLRTGAQVKRGIREGRINDDRALDLVPGNVLTELRRGVIMFILSKMGSKTVVEIGELMEDSPAAVQSAIVSMIHRGEVEMIGLDGDAPVFSRVLETTPKTTLVLKKIVRQIRGVSKSIEGNLRSSVEKSLTQLETLFEKLQKLGQYDETLLADPINNLRVAVDDATEAVLRSESADSSEDLRLLVSAGLEAFARFRLKITLEKGPNLVSGMNVYGEKLDPEIYERMMSTYLDSELERGTILVLIRELGAMTAEDLAMRMDVPQSRVLQHLLRMKRDELLTLVGESHGYLLYDVPRTPTEAEIAIETASSHALQLAEAKVEVRTLLDDLRAKDIGKLASALETLSKGRDKLTKVSVDGINVGESVLAEVEDNIKTAVSLTYRTRTRIPSTRAKVTLDDLIDVDVPSVLDEYRSMMGYAPLLGFGTIEWDQSKCLGCKSCEIVCPEDAIQLRPMIQVTEFFDFSEDSLGELPVNRALFYRTVRNLAAKKPAGDIVLNKDSPGFGRVDVDLWLCVACRTCVRRCPGPAPGALELDLKWSLPEVVRQITAQE
ncbi:MAG: 4Fe-4S dicluster domain-containing protein [Candidatus Thorarchaeota archaeon]